VRRPADELTLNGEKTVAFCRERSGHREDGLIALQIHGTASRDRVSQHRARAAAVFARDAHLSNGLPDQGEPAARFAVSLMVGFAGSATSVATNGAAKAAVQINPLT